ncbi:MAG TPA: helix-turn-helix transcriptional regulator [Pseudonocardiaceae bacterium]
MSHTMHLDDVQIGQRIREIRIWRGMSLSAAAGLAGMSASYLSLLERGLRPVTRRATVEALAHAFRVSPVDLTGRPHVSATRAGSELCGAMAPVAEALAAWSIGEFPDSTGRPWHEVTAELGRFNTVLRADSDYAAQTAILPRLIGDLLAAVAEPTHRRTALIGLIDAYHATGNIARRLGYVGVPALAVERMRQAAHELDDPVWTAFVAWSRAHYLGGTNRSRQYELATRAADSAGACPEIRGMANLTAALAAAAQGRADIARLHLSEAAAIADGIGADVGPWRGNVNMQFGRTNVGIWRVSIAVELGGGGRVAEIAAGVRPETITRSRQAGFWIDYGRGLLAERRTRDRGITALLRAESLAPQQVRNHLFLREAVAGLLAAARRDAGGRELRGLAYRMGVAPKE